MSGLEWTQPTPTSAVELSANGSHIVDYDTDFVKFFDPFQMTSTTTASVSAADTGYVKLYHNSTNNMICFKNSAGVEFCLNETGPQGAQGPQGSAGQTGAQGPQGVQGAQGSQGSAGQTGAQGPQGETGAQGPAGPQGTTGGNSSLPVNLRFNDPNGSPSSTGSTSYTVLGRFVYRGSLTDPTLTRVKWIVSVSSVGTTMAVRLWNATLVNTVSEVVTPIVLTTPTVVTTTSFANIPLTESVIEVQIRRVNTMGGGQAELHCVQVYG